MNPLVELESAGQSPWLDDLHRDLVRKGDLKRMIEEQGLKGMTSNPSIFEKSIGETDEYKDELQSLLSKGKLDDMGIYESLAIEDIQGACDVFRPTYEKAGRNDGFVSLEVSPTLANETEKTVADAQRLWKTVNRENLMVKVPGTKAGVPAVKQLIGEGISINVTLLFSIEAYEDIVEAYMSGLEHLVKSGGDPSRVASVASFFLSRIDTAVETKIKKLDSSKQENAGKLRNKVAIAYAKMAYQSWKRLFAGSRWDALVAKGAKPQRLLWASTGTKDPALAPVYYVNALIGKETVNTMPPATMKAFGESGTVEKDAIEHDLAGAKATLQALQDAGISIDTVTSELVEDGIKKFVEAFDKLLGGVAKKRRELMAEGSQTQSAA